jgi:hypothetical protein
MSSKEVSLNERVQTSYKQLFQAATNLNIASEELSSGIAVLESALGKLNLGVSAWATITAGGEPPQWWSRDIGFTQIGDQWVVALRSSSGDQRDADGEYDSTTVWRFNLAPRWMQNEAVTKIPELFDKLTAQAVEMRNKLKSRAERTLQLAAIVEDVAKIEDDWRAKLVSAMKTMGRFPEAKLLAEDEADVVLANSELRIKVPKRSAHLISPEDVQNVVKHLGYPDLRCKLVIVPDRKSTADQHAKGGNKQ